VVGILETGGFDTSTRAQCGTFSLGAGSTTFGFGFMTDIPFGCEY